MKSKISDLSTIALTSVLALGCASIAAARSPAAPGNGNDDSMNSNQPVTDTWITTKVKSTLATTEGVSSTDISVTTVDGVVTLTGVLDNDLAVKKAVAVAKSIDGVKSVDAAGLKSKG